MGVEPAVQPRKAIAVTAALFIAQPAFAQESPTIFASDNPVLIRTDVAGNRAGREFSPQPVMLGTLAVQPQLALRTTYDDNLFNAPPPTRSDVYWTIEPSVSVARQHGASSLEINASGTIQRFASTTSQNSEQYAANGRYATELAPDLTVELGISAARVLEPRGQGGPVFQGYSAPLDDQLSGTFGVRFDRGRLRIESGGFVARSDYLPLINGRQVFDQSFRNAIDVGVHNRIELSDNDLVGLYVDNQLTYINTAGVRVVVPGVLPAGAFLPGYRDATDIVVRGGVRAASPGFAADLFAGWRSRDYRWPIFGDYSGFIFGGRVEWYATNLITLQLTGGQEFKNSAVVLVPGVLNHYVALKFFYDLAPRVMITGGARVDMDRYRDIDFAALGIRPTGSIINLSTQNWSGSMQVEYRLSERMALLWSGRYRSRSIDDTGLLTLSLNPYSGFSSDITLRLSM